MCFVWCGVYVHIYHMSHYVLDENSKPMSHHADTRKNKSVVDSTAKRKMNLKLHSALVDVANKERKTNIFKSQR